MNKQHKINKSENIFCLPKFGKKKQNNNGTDDKNTETIRITKFDISTVVDFSIDESTSLTQKQRQIKDFPACPDIKGTEFIVSRSPIITKDQDFPKNENSCEVNFDRSLERLSMTLKDIIDQTDMPLSILSTSSSKSFSFPIQRLSGMLPNFTNNRQDEEPNENEITVYKKDLSGAKRKRNNENFKVKQFDYYETTTLLPIGQGIASLTNPKPNFQNSPVKSFLQNSLSEQISQSDFQQFPDMNASIPNILEQSTTIEIPPHMPPLLTLNRNGYSSIYLSKLPNRRRIISENLFPRKIQNFHCGNNTIEDDNADINTISFCNANSNSKRSSRAPSAFINYCPEVPERDHQLLTNNRFSQLPTKSSSSYSSLSNSTVINNGHNPVFYKSNEIPRNIQNHSSTAF